MKRINIIFYTLVMSFCTGLFGLPVKQVGYMLVPTFIITFLVYRLPLYNHPNPNLAQYSIPYFSSRYYLFLLIIELVEFTIWGAVTKQWRIFLLAIPTVVFLVYKLTRESIIVYNAIKKNKENKTNNL